MASTRSGMTLVESIVAIFILTAAMVVSFSLYDSALQYSARIETRHRAVQAAERRLEEIRAWSRDVHGTNGTRSFNQGWGAYHNQTTTDPEFPGLTIFTTALPRRLLSPASEFEEVHFSAQEDENIPDDSTEKKELEDATYLVGVTVSWGPRPSQQLTQWALLADPVRDLGWDNSNLYKAIDLSYKVGGAWVGTPPATLAKNQTLKIRANVADRHGNPVDNAVIQYYVDPDCSGDGILETSPSTPTEVSFTNQYRVDKDPEVSGDEIVTHTGGYIRIVARARLGGKEAVRRSPRIDLQD